LGNEIAQALRPQARNGVLSGPSFAHEVALGQPTALVAASTDTALAEQAVAAFHSDSLRVYTSTDPSVWRWVAPSRTCSPLPPASPMA
jgi:glycerol-3-phosphate dehydrogenase (NAD(P)+)